MPVRLVVEEGPHPGVTRAEVVRRTRRMLLALQMPDAELSIVLTGDDQIKILNRIYRKKNRPTDVLAFSQLEGRAIGSRRLLGDVIVSVPTARRQAEERGVDVAAEVTMLLAHGLLHLLGWDHETPAKDRKMRRETQRLCDAATLGPQEARRSKETRRLKEGTGVRGNGNSIAATTPRNRPRAKR
jgi:probable rRNA maturation factor